jgi:hypothetical protein
MKYCVSVLLFVLMFASHGNAQIQKRILLEEFSTAPCGFCPDGDIVAAQLVAKYPQIIWVTHHAGFGVDSLTVNESKYIANAFTNFAPGAAIDRGDYPIPVYTNNPPYIAVSRQKWDSVCTAHLNDTAFVNLQLEHSFNAATRMFTCTVSGRFDRAPRPGDLRLQLYLVEDSVVGIGSGFDQKNYYNGTPGHPCYQKGDPIVGYVHHRVIRAIPTGNWGMAGIVSSAPASGTTFSHTFSNLSIPARWKERDMDVIAFVSYMDTSALRRKVLNSTTKPLLDGTTSVQPVAVAGVFETYPNPAFDRVNFRVESRSELTVVDRLGRIAMQSRLEPGINALPVRQLPAGVYFYRISTENLHSYTGRMIVGGTTAR